ncbi:hypothetical protein [Paragemmobacter aquarius]|uniref:hypothetical protein n=1 Tax=Paragemmobacter aquarius TaxID=2169400 RepID=UPI00131EF784|nr:hypothetical protein [Gemmobacter aquarius]
MTYLHRKSVVMGDPLVMPDQDLSAPFHDRDAPGIRTDRATLMLRAMALSVPLGVTLGLGWLSLGRPGRRPAPDTSGPVHPVSPPHEEYGFQVGQYPRLGAKPWCGA